MTTKQIPISDATASELRQFCEHTLGIADIPPNATRAALRGMIAAAGYDKPDIGVSVDDDKPADLPVDARKRSNPTPGSSAGDPKVSITISAVPGTGGERPVPVSPNGVCMLIPRGRMVEVPYRYYLVLRDAVETVVEQNQETGEFTEREVQSYPFQVNRMPPQDEIDAWHAKFAPKAA